MKNPLIPSERDFLEALGIIPLSNLSIASKKFSFASKPLYVNNLPIKIYASQVSISKIADALGTSHSIIKRMIKLFWQGGLKEVYDAKWGRGGIRGNYEAITDEEKAWATS